MILPQVDTPAVLIDRPLLDVAIAEMAAIASDRGLQLRPHVKTHKIPEIADLQLGAGAAGITVATIGEAEVFVGHGANDVFIAYPLWLTVSTAARLARVARKARVSVGIDSAEAALNAADLLGEEASGIDFLVEIDSGHHRSGVLPREAGQVARAATAAGLRVIGAFTFPGHSYAPDGGSAAAEDERQSLVAAAAVLRETGVEVLRLSGGSTPSAAHTLTKGATEIRPGVYVFGDAQQVALGSCREDQVSLSVLATVVSRHPEGQRRIVLDAGSKVLGSDRPAWLAGHGLVAGHPAAVVSSLSEHHASVAWPAGEPLPELGRRLRIIPNHVCLVTNLVDEVVVVEADGQWRRWAVAARGRNS